MSDSKLKTALVASVVLNLFLVGAGVSAAVWFKHEAHDRVPLFVAARKLDAPTQQRLQSDMRARALEAAPDFREAREARRRAAQLAAAPEFDRKAIEAELARADAAGGRGRAKLQAAMLDFMAPLPADQRAQIAPVLQGRHLLRERRRDRLSDAK